MKIPQEINDLIKLKLQVKKEDYFKYVKVIEIDKYKFGQRRKYNEVDSDKPFGFWTCTKRTNNVTYKLTSCHTTT